MILTDKEILNHIEKGLIKIEPFNISCLGTNSYDVHLGKTLALYESDILDAKTHNKIKTFEIPEEGYGIERRIRFVYCGTKRGFAGSWRTHPHRE